MWQRLQDQVFTSMLFTIHPSENDVEYHHWRLWLNPRYQMPDAQPQGLKDKTFERLDELEEEFDLKPRKITRKVRGRVRTFKQYPIKHSRVGSRFQAKLN